MIGLQINIMKKVNLHRTVQLIFPTTAIQNNMLFSQKQFAKKTDLQTTLT